MFTSNKKAVISELHKSEFKQIDFVCLTESLEHKTQYENDLFTIRQIISTYSLPYEIRMTNRYHHRFILTRG